MEPLLILFVVAAVLIVLDAASSRWGVDSRTGSNDPRQSAPGLFVR